MCRSERFLSQAAEEAARSELDIKHGALLVRSGKVIGAGHNSSRTRISAAPGAFSGVSLHSEVPACPLQPLTLPQPPPLPPSPFASRAPCPSGNPLIHSPHAPVHARSRRYSTPFRVFYEAQKTRKMLRRCDLYVVRLLPERSDDSAPDSCGALHVPSDVIRRGDAARFGNSQPCVRCLRALDAFGVNRVVFSTGETGADDGGIGCEVRNVRELLRGAGHSSRGDKSQQLLLPNDISVRCHAC